MSPEKIKTAPKGRPPISEDVRRTFRISVPLNGQEQKIILAAVESSGTPAAIWARNILLAAAQKK